MSEPRVVQQGTTSIDGKGVPVYRLDTRELVILYIVWELHWDNTIHIRSICTTEEQAHDYLYGWKKSGALKETVRRLQIEPVYANHMYAESMYAYAAAIKSSKIVAEVGE